MNNVKVAAAQFGSTPDKEANIKKIRSLAETARDLGATITCFPELCTTTYFCWESNPQHFELAETIPGPSSEAVASIAKDTQLTLVCSLYERDANGVEYYNSSFIVDQTGEIKGKYRKNSIPLSVGPNGVAANEKMYFKQGNLGYPVFETSVGHAGILICYDRHFPEGARLLGLNGADIVFIPTAAWRAPMKEAWEIELRGHAIANALYVCGVNKVGREEGGSPDNHYFGSSMIVDPSGNIVVRAGDEEDEVVIADIDFDYLAEHRRLWPIFRDRRPDAYGQLTQ
jgi:beta-ureidopropionase